MKRQGTVRLLGVILAFASACGPVSAGPEAEPTLSEIPPVLTQAALSACNDVVSDYGFPDPALVTCFDNLNESIRSLDNRWPSDEMIGEHSAGWLAARHVLTGWEKLNLVDPNDAIGGAVQKSMMDALEYQRLHVIDNQSLVFH